MTAKKIAEYLGGIKTVKNEKQRDPYFQAIRGICMCAVILIHCQAQGHTAMAEYYQIVLRQIINFAVATFIFMAGYFACPYKMRGGVLE